MMRITLQQFIDRSVCKHGNVYDYSKTVLGKDNKEKVVIVCRIHEEFLQSPNKHADQGRGCPKCAKEQNRKRWLSNFAKQKTNEEFISEANIKHNHRYEYLTEYKSCFEKVQIKCKKCTTIWCQQPSNHLAGHGCPKCAFVESKGEKKIADCLDSIGVKYQRQKWFDGCRGKKRPLPFDFYIPAYNALIEFDGEQHFKPKNFKGSMTISQTEKAYLTTKKYDNVKNDYCVEKSIPLLRIPFHSENQIEDLINEFLENLNVTSR